MITDSYNNIIKKCKYLNKTNIQLNIKNKSILFSTEQTTLYLKYLFSILMLVVLVYLQNKYQPTNQYGNCTRRCWLRQITVVKAEHEPVLRQHPTSNIEHPARGASRMDIGHSLSPNDPTTQRTISLHNIYTIC